MLQFYSYLKARLRVLERADLYDIIAVILFMQEANDEL